MEDNLKFLGVCFIILFFGACFYIIFKIHDKQKQVTYWELCFNIHALFHFDNEFRAFMIELPMIYPAGNFDSLLAPKIFGFKFNISKEEVNQIKQNIEIKANSIINNYNRKKDIINYKIDFI